MNNRTVRVVIVLLSIVAAGVAAWVAVGGFENEILSPLPWGTLLPAIGIEELLAKGGVDVRGDTFVPFIGAVWGACLLLHVVVGKKQVPRMSIVAAILFAVLDTVYLVLSFRHGVLYDGINVTVALCGLNAVCLVALAIAHRFNRRSPSILSNYGFHAVFALWVCWFAFPWLGEKP